MASMGSLVERHVDDRRVVVEPGPVPDLRRRPATADGGYEAHDALIHPDDRAAMRGALARAALDGEPFDITYRLIRPDGVERIMHGRGASAERVDGRVTPRLGHDAGRHRAPPPGGLRAARPRPASAPPSSTRRSASAS